MRFQGCTWNWFFQVGVEDSYSGLGWCIQGQQARYQALRWTGQLKNRSRNSFWGRSQWYQFQNLSTDCRRSRSQRWNRSQLGRRRCCSVASKSTLLIAWALHKLSDGTAKKCVKRTQTGSGADIEKENHDQLQFCDDFALSLSCEGLSYFPCIDVGRRTRSCVILKCDQNRKSTPEFLHWVLHMNLL